MLNEVFEQALIGDSANAMLDSFRAEAGQGIPNALGPGGFSSVRDAA
jgi:hypothetical protein